MLKINLRIKSLAFVIAFCMFVGCIPTTLSAYNWSEADLAFDSFNNAFYTVNNGNGYYKADIYGGHADFWKEAEMIEMAVDAYERSGNPVYLGMVTELCNGFIDKHGSDWQNNIYNDDIMWICIAFLRAYQVTGNTAFRNKAKEQFDLTYARAWSCHLGGGLWWTTDKNEKNACVNGPAAIAAYLLYKTYGNCCYLNKAINIYNWERNTLFVPSTGAVNDHILKNGTINTAKYTYNQGTFIGIANYLYKETGRSSYLNDAKKAADYTKNNMCVNGILPDEYATSDQPGFKGIFARWLSRLVKDSGQTQYVSWMLNNADAAWSKRNSSGLMWGQWRNQTPDAYLQSWECSGGVVIMQVFSDFTTPEVTFYEHADYGGTAVSLGVGEYTMDQLIEAGIPNDWVSSLKVPNGLTVEIYQNHDFTGTVWIFTSNTPYVGDQCNDDMSSVRIY